MEVIAAEGRTLASKLIKWATGKPYTHVAIRYTNEESDWMVHSTIGGVQPEWWFYFRKKYDGIRRFLIPLDVAPAAADNVVEKLAYKSYDYGGIVGHGLAIALGLKRNPFGSRRRFVCTELIVELHRECNRLDGSLDLREFDPEMLTPGELVTYYEQHPKIAELPHP